MVQYTQSISPEQKILVAWDLVGEVFKKLPLGGIRDKVVKTITLEATAFNLAVRTTF